MSLSGNLGFVSLDEVLRLITRSKQSGAVDVKGDRIHGRIYVGRSGVSLATTYNNDTLRRHLAKSGVLTADQVREVAAGTTDLGSLPEADKVNVVLREMSVEGLHQMGLHGSSFEVFQEETTPFGSPAGFDLEDLLSDARRRMSEWEEVKAIVSDLDREVRLQRDLGERMQVTIDRDAWRVVSQMGHGASIRDLSDQLGTTEFWTARVAAGLVEEDLMTMESAPAEVDEIPEPEEVTGAVGEPEPYEAYEPYEEPVAEVDYTTAQETAAEVEEDTVADQAMADEPAADAPEADAPEELPVEAVMEAGTDLAEGAEETVDPNESWWKEPERGSSTDEPVFAEAAAHDDEVEEDTEKFLEKVFSELEPSGEAEEGYGLLRRRRMGALRDNTPS